MKLILFIILVVILSGCSSHSIKIGKRCTNLAKDNTYEKSLIWFVDKKNMPNFNEKINKENCISNGEKI